MAGGAALAPPALRGNLPAAVHLRSDSAADSSTTGRHKRIRLVLLPPQVGRSQLGPPPRLLLPLSEHRFELRAWGGAHRPR